MKRTTFIALTFALAGLVPAALAADKPFKPEKGFKSLFNGKDFTDWSVNESKETFSIKDGAIVAKGPRSHCFYVGKVNGGMFKDFELKVDVMTEKSSNGGIYFHTAFQEQSWPDKGFEVQVNNSYDRDPRRTGSLYMVQDNKEIPAQDFKWFTEHIIVKGNHVQVFVDGKKIVDWTQPEGYTGPNKNSPGRVLSSGTFALQGHDPGSTVHYKNIRVKVLK
ncbi:MAG: DUF1080 domain-containing protein [Acidobacteria bacterium]|nr:DUF1080 domain-containing protein [Acidobacteriota bacterium]